MSVNPRTVHKKRQNITALPLYHSGHLLKKSSKEKNFKKYYGELRGATLFLYEDDTQDTYTEKLDLEKLKSMDLESQYQNKAPTIFTLTLHTEEVQLKMDNADTGEVWRGYILTVVHNGIPSKLQLLPGQMLKLKEVLEEERKRKTNTSRPALPPRPTFLHSLSSAAGSTSTSKDTSLLEMPECFYDVTRQEAEHMLKANPEYGGVILRPSTLTNNYALTLRQQTSSGPVMRNYRVSSTNAGFVIELDTPVKVSSLTDVLKYFLEKTEYRLFPYVASQPYDTRIDVSTPPKCIRLPSSTPKDVPKAQVAPMKRHSTNEKLPPTEENEYLMPEDESPDDHELQLVHELREAVKSRKENIYMDSEKDDVTGSENKSRVKLQSNSVEWIPKSSSG
ncbi:signal-transducing adaptor protein 1-like [Odontesthes bonariensis]|uniref:signal-transducing adaptor protein 1-like n=1 Tax=Odontesthes bonariensis TaxID=219752 RepID=UPI003F58F64A